MLLLPVEYKSIVLNTSYLNKELVSLLCISTICYAVMLLAPVPSEEEHVVIASLTGQKEASTTAANFETTSTKAEQRELLDTLPPSEKVNSQRHQSANRNIDYSGNQSSNQNSSQHSDSENEQHNEWYDVWQRSFTDSMDFTVRQLDGLFSRGDAHKSNSEEARAEGRIQFAWEPRDGTLTDTDVRFRIRVKLPALEDRVDLLLSDNEDETQDNTIRAARNTDNNERDQTTIALRFRPQQDSHFSYRVGAGRRDQLYVRARYRDASAFTDSLSALYDSEVYYYSRDRLGAEAGLAFQYDVNSKHLLRQDNRVYFRDDTNDWLWRHEINHLYAINEHNAIVGRAMVEGLSRPNYRVQEVYAGVRWRSNTVRDWLFFEVEPFVLWLRDEDFNASFGVAMRVEVFYGQSR